MRHVPAIQNVAHQKPECGPAQQLSSVHVPASAGPLLRGPAARSRFLQSFGPHKMAAINLSLGPDKQFTEGSKKGSGSRVRGPDDQSLESRSVAGGAPLIA